MTEPDLARVLLAQLRRTPNATPAEALVAFRRRAACEVPRRDGRRSDRQYALIGVRRRKEAVSKDE